MENEALNNNNTETLDSKFDDIDEKVDFLIELCKSLTAENAELTEKNKMLESELSKKNEIESLYDKQHIMIREKVDGLLSKLDNYSEIP